MHFGLITKHHFELKTTFVTCWATFGRNCATFYASIWSHCSESTIKGKAKLRTDGTKGMSNYFEGAKGIIESQSIQSPKQPVLLSTFAWREVHCGRRSLLFWTHFCCFVQWQKCQFVVVRLNVTSSLISPQRWIRAWNQVTNAFVRKYLSTGLSLSMDAVGTIL